MPHPSSRKAKPGPKARAKELRGVSPQDRERFARWIEHKVERFPSLIGQSEAYSRAHPEDVGEANQRRYWINAVAFARHLAYLLRAETPRQADDVGPAQEVKGE